MDAEKVDKMAKNDHPNGLTSALKSVKLCLLRAFGAFTRQTKYQRLLRWSWMDFGCGDFVMRNRDFSRRRGQKGEFLIDGSLSIAMLFGLVMLPCTDLATLGLRHVFLSAAARNAVHVASKAKTFETSLNKPSAKVIADQVAKATANGFSGIDVESVDTYILATNLDTQETIRYAGKLPRPADTSSYVYNVETVLTAKVHPLFTLNKDLMGSIPGLTVPMEGKASAQEYCEHTQGLNY